MIRRALLAAMTVAPIAACTTLRPQRPAEHGIADRPFAEPDRQLITAVLEKGIAEQRLPGLVAGVWIPGRGSYVRAFGIAETKTGEALRADHRFRIASITKTFTATAVLRLADQRVLHLDETLDTYVPGIANGNAITLRDLLGMTSGVYDFTSDPQFLADFANDPLMAFGPSDVIAIVRRHAPQSRPGETVSYCDTNYVFLGLILERATGKPAAEIIREQVIEPLGLRETIFPVTAAMPEPFAHGYYAGDDGDGPLRDCTQSNPAVAWTAGAMISSLADLRAWTKALATGALLSPAMHADRLRFATIGAYGPITLGYGLGIASFGGFLGHNGAILGYSTLAVYLPDADAVFVLEGNKASNFSNETTDIFFALARKLFPERFPPARVR